MSSPTPLPPKDGIDFDSLPWNMNLPEESSYVHLTTTGEWSEEHYDPSTDSGSLFQSVHKYSDTALPLYPSATSLNYGTTIWEGLKCFRKKDGTPVVFRPDQNFHRFVRGAEQMCLPKPSRELFLRGVQHAVQQNSQLIPPYGEGMKLYVRPMLLGSGQQLGLYPSPEFSLLYYVSPTVSSKIAWVDTHCILRIIRRSTSPSLFSRVTTSRMLPAV
jgi:branched-chain amino acid aminotransferase